MRKIYDRQVVEYIYEGLRRDAKRRSGRVLSCMLGALLMGYSAQTYRGEHV